MPGAQRSLSNELERSKLLSIPSLFTDSQAVKVKLLAYCLMPDHYHLLVKSSSLPLVSKYIGDIQNSYSRYVNISRKRKGPLWQSRFRRVRVMSDAQLAHVTRYIHLNPVTSYLCEKPQDWIYSSYRHYITNDQFFLTYLRELSFKTAKRYRHFVEDQIDYQRKLRLIKNHLF
ncbi:transposase [Candidatus Microgenomates bacterium]|nr:transposase [Candidatus Microgenomates bacterium]